MLAFKGTPPPPRAHPDSELPVTFLGLGLNINFLLLNKMAMEYGAEHSKH